MAIWGLVGVGVGVMIPSQIGSIVAILAFTQFVEPLLRTAAAFVDGLDEVGRFLPGAAGDALVGASFFTVFAGVGGGAAPLDWWQGGLVLAAFALLFGVIGSLTTWRRDVS
jgi:ABC-2 type transport system permease protein